MQRAAKRLLDSHPIAPPIAIMHQDMDAEIIPDADEDREGKGAHEVHLEAEERDGAERDEHRRGERQKDEEDRADSTELKKKPAEDEAEAEHASQLEILLHHLLRHRRVSIGA